MTIVSIGYAYSGNFSSPAAWLQKINFYTVILEALANKHSVHAIERIAFEGIVVQNNVHYHFVGPGKKTNRFPLRIHRKIAALKPDIVLVNGFIYPFQIIQLLLHLRSKTKLIVLHRADRPGSGMKKRLQQIADKAVYRYLFASAEQANEWVEKKVINNKNKVLEILQSSSVFKHSNKTEHNKERLNYLWVGRLNENKDPLTVVKAFLRYSLQNARARLLMIFQSEELLSQIQSLIGDSSNIILLGNKERHELEEWYNDADFFISGSHREGSGIALIEAMSCGCIPIITNIPSFKAIAKNVGFFYEAGNTDDCFAALVASADCNKNDRMQQVLQQYYTELSPKAIAGKIEAALYD